MISATISFGEDRPTTSRTNRVYFFHNINGTDYPITNAEGFKRVNSKSNYTANGGRLVFSTNTFSKPATIRMYCVRSERGKIKDTSEIYIDVDENKPLIKVTGFSGFGHITVNGSIDLKRTGRNVKELTALHNYEVITENNKERKLILW